MRCDICGEQTAVIQVQETVNGQQTSVRLCAKCASLQKFQLSAIAGGAMRKLLESVSELANRLATDGDAEAAAVCPQCGQDAHTFRQTQLAGCPACYTTFASLVTELHPEFGNSLYAGKHWHPARDTEPPEKSLQPPLESQLARAIAEERYEEAARIRDQITALIGSRR